VVQLSVNKKDNPEEEKFFLPAASGGQKISVRIFPEISSDFN